MENEKNLIITPRTKVMQLIEAYPQLEDILIVYIPTFKKLKNPLLRKTIAQITTLQQAAAIGNVKVGDLINHLRKEVGQDLYAEGEEGAYNYKKPVWFNEKAVNQEFDARDMLAAGEHPVNQVIADLKKVEKGPIYKLTAPFLTAPLIDKAKSLGFEHWIVKEGEELYFVYFYKA